MLKLSFCVGHILVRNTFCLKDMKYANDVYAGSHSIEVICIMISGKI